MGAQSHERKKNPKNILSLAESIFAAFNGANQYFRMEKKAWPKKGNKLSNNIKNSMKLIFSDVNPLPF